jgi:hypothetical protein
MNQAAQAIGVTAEMLEVTLFQPPADPPGEDEAAS